MPESAGRRQAGPRPAETRQGARRDPCADQARPFRGRGRRQRGGGIRETVSQGGTGVPACRRSTMSSAPRAKMSGSKGLPIKERDEGTG